MGGAVSSGENNDELIDNLMEADYIKTPLVEKVFRAVDRAFYYTKTHKQSPYKDLAWKHGNLHMSAPCIYSEVLENLHLTPGLSFLNIGSGTGYLSTMAGLMLGRGGINHGIELHSDVVEYARFKLEQFKISSHAVDLFEFCEPSFSIGNCMDALPTPYRYDRIYCGAACPPKYLQVIIDSLKIGGISVVPVNDSLVQMKRISESRVERKVLLSVSFASLVESMGKPSIPTALPEWNPLKLSEMCRAVIRSSIRCNCQGTAPEVSTSSKSAKRPKKRTTNRLTQGTCVLSRLNGTSESNDGNRPGIVSITYALRNRGSPSDSRTEDDEDNHGGTSHDTPDNTDGKRRKESEDNGSHSSDKSCTLPEDLDSYTARASSDLSFEVSSDDEMEDTESSRRSPPGKISPVPHRSILNKNGSNNESESSATERTSQRRCVHWVDRGNSGKRRQQYPSTSSKDTPNSSNSTQDSSLDIDMHETIAEALAEASTENSVEIDDSSEEGELPDLDDDRRDGSTNPIERMLFLNVPFDVDNSDTDGSDTEHEPRVHVMHVGPAPAPPLSPLTDLTDEYNVDEPPPEITHTLTIQMRQKIKSLPLPTALKLYLNYNRNL
ncbi:unnamed protein product [Allacma fusca]|uniref:Protein-L-isoaspartate O-methyltransferase n=1 Tax=Allacma fusca TaxID=39272 RepID=A0A8J2MB02_9HEXA|nr:unnamed protein product [Allacma fusca]